MSFSTPPHPIVGEATTPLGATVREDGVSYRVWAPDHRELHLRVQRAGGTMALLPGEAQGRGYFGLDDRAGRAGDRYQWVLADGSALPDPASRFQPEGVHGPSECIDPHAYVWRCATWQRPGWSGQSVYELHVGTFTREGTFRAAIQKLDHLAALGVEAIELMPLADFPGERNWGYDGVALYAPARCYGRPDELRELVDAAHARGLAVILDVVYNHLGPDGNYLARFAKEYFDEHRHTPWGQAFHLAGTDSRPVREFFLGNAAYWLDEFRFDGLRLDATHAIEDPSAKHLLAELAEVAHARGAFLIAEDERNASFVLRNEDGAGHQIDAVWSDDFHHQVRVALTGVQESYFKSYRGSPGDLVRTLQNGWFYTGQAYPQWQGRPRGSPSAHLPASAFVTCIENHDQVGNRARGERLEHLISPSAFRAASALLCLSPYPPLIFMGQEWAASTPFLYFTDHAGELGRQVSAGRQKEFAAAGLNQGLSIEEVPDPQARETFSSSKLAWDEVRRCPHATVLALYREGLRQRRAWLHGVMTERANWRAGAFHRAVALRYHGAGQPDRLVVSALQGDTRILLTAEPLLTAPDGCVWQLELDSNEVGRGEESSMVLPATGWTAGAPRVVDTLVFTAPATVLLVARKAGERRFD